MEIRSNLSSLMEHGYEGAAKQGREKKNIPEPSSGSINNQASQPINKPQKSRGSDMKEIAERILVNVGDMGEFKDKKGLEEATDVGIGPDIRFALKSKNPDFIKRILWGPLTVDEYRELKYRLRELHNKRAESNNILSGKTVEKDMIQTEELKPIGEKPPKTIQDKNMIDLFV